MAFFSLALSFISLFLVTEQAHARLTTPPPPPTGCQYEGKTYQRGEVIYEEKCYGAKCTELGEVMLYDKRCAFGISTLPPMI